MNHTVPGSARERVVSEDYYTSPSFEAYRRSRRGRKRAPRIDDHDVERDRSRAAWRRDRSEAQLAQNDAVAAASLQRQAKRVPMHAMFGRRHRLPGLLDADKALQQRRDIVRQSSRRHRSYRRRLKRKGVESGCAMIVVVDPRWQKPIGRLQDLELGHVRRTTLRWLRSLPMGCMITGCIELVVREDQAAQPPRCWVPHINLVITFRGADTKASRRALRRAFPVRADADSAVYVPIKAVQAYYRRGALRYSTKGLQLHRVERRVALSGKDAPRKMPLRVADRDELVRYLADKEATHFLIQPRRPAA